MMGMSKRNPPCFVSSRSAIATIGSLLSRLCLKSQWGIGACAVDQNAVQSPFFWNQLKNFIVRGRQGVSKQGWWNRIAGLFGLPLVRWREAGNVRVAGGAIAAPEFP